MSASGRMINDYLRRLANELGIDELELDEAGLCGLELADLHLQVNIEVIDAANLFCLHTDIGEYYPREQDKLFPLLLEANLYGQQTQGATLSIDPQRRQVVLCLTRNLQELRDYAQFERLVQIFIETSAHWAERLDAMS